MKRPILVLMTGAAAILVADAGAVTTRAFETTSYKEFDEGEADGVFISSLGEITPGLDVKRENLEGEAIWTAVRGGDGTIYAGAIDKGTVTALSGGKQRVLADFSKETPWIGALALDAAEKKLYVGTVASGSVHAVDLKSGKSELVVKLDGADHVWALAWADGGKTLLAATGAEGKLFAVDVAAKKAKVAWDSDEEQLLSMLVARDGSVWLGSSGQAILYRFEVKSGQARAVHDFAGSEIKALAEVGGAVVAAVNEFDAKGGSAPSKKAQKAPAGGTPVKAPEAGSAPGSDKPTGIDAAPRPGERKGKGGLFRVESDGRVEQLHALAEGYFTSLAVDGGDVLAGAGVMGRVYRVRDDRTVQTAFDVEERQVTAVMAGKGGLAFATGDSAALYLATGAPKQATYTSKVFDAGAPARWGNLRWRGQGGVSVETRSGNTAKPDAAWSGWQKLGKAQKAGGDAMVGVVASPSGRYVQYRVVFAGAGAVRQVTMYYLPMNQRARIVDVIVGDGEANKTPVTLQAGAAKPRSPVMKVKWKVENPDGDELAYALELRPEGDTEWRPVPTGGDGPYTKSELDWNTEALPDGWYRLRVTASDARANPSEVSLSHAYISQPFLVDNQKPSVMGLEVKYPAAAGRAVDSFSRIDEIAWSLDGGEWVMAYPKDGIFDDPSEAFSIKLPAGLAPGAHTLSVRVADEADNIGAATVTFRVK